MADRGVPDAHARLDRRRARLFPDNLAQPTGGGRCRDPHRSVGGDERRRDELNDPAWLAARYELASAADIAAELNVNPQQVLAALRRHNIPIRSRHDTQRSRRPLLHDPEALAAAVEASSVAEVAKGLGVSVIGVQAALKRNGAQSAHRYKGRHRLTRPSPSQLERWWLSEQTLKGVARRARVRRTMFRSD